MNVFINYFALALALLFCVSVDESYEERTTICRTFDPDKEFPLDRKDVQTVFMVNSNDQQRGSKSLDECKEKYMQQIIKQAIKGELSALERRLDEKLSAMKSGLTILDDGWIGLLNGYQYKLIHNYLNYTASKQLCNTLGADLAVFGIQDMGTRRIIKKAFNLRSAIYIGMNYVDVDGILTWRWVNGKEVESDAVALWQRDNPSGKIGENCTTMSAGNLLSYDTTCSNKLYVLCEKEWN